MTQFSLDIKDIYETISITTKFRQNIIDKFGLNFINDYVVLRIADSDLYICVIDGMISTTVFPSKAYFFKKQFADHTIKIIDQAGFTGRVVTTGLLDAIDFSVEFFENYALENFKTDLPEISLFSE